MVQSILHHIAASLKESASAREIAELTDRQFADIGGDRLSAKLLEKARQRRAREHVPFHASVGVFSYPTV